MSALVVEIDQRRVQRVLMGFFLRIEIANCVAFFHRAQGGELAGVIQNRFHQRGFSGRTMAGQGNIADGLGGVADHRGLLSNMVFLKLQF